MYIFVCKVTNFSLLWQRILQFLRFFYKASLINKQSPPCKIAQRADLCV